MTNPSELSPPGTQSLAATEISSPHAEEVADVFLPEAPLAETVNLRPDPAQQLLEAAALYGISGRIIRNKHVRLGTPDDPETPSEHSRQRYTIELDIVGTPLYIRVTEPEQPEPNEPAVLTKPPTTFAHSLGLSEVPDGGSGRNAHDELARQRPNDRLVTFGTEGMNRYGSKLPAGKALTHSFEEKAENRIFALRLIAKNDPVVLFGISMGTVVDDEVIALNQKYLDSGNPWAINIQGVIHHSHAQVPPSRIVQDMFWRFPRHMAGDATRTVRMQPEKRAGYIATMGSVMLRLPVLGGNILQLARGTSKHRSTKAAQVHPTGYISGEDDPLLQAKHLSKLERSGLAKVMLKPGIGHAACMQAEVMAVDVSIMHDVMRQEADTVEAATVSS